MINFDAMDFSELRSEEVMFLWRSVYSQYTYKWNA